MVPCNLGGLIKDQARKTRSVLGAVTKLQNIMPQADQRDNAALNAKKRGEAAMLRELLPVW